MVRTRRAADRRRVLCRALCGGLCGALCGVGSAPGVAQGVPDQAVPMRLTVKLGAVTAIVHSRNPLFAPSSIGPQAAQTTLQFTPSLTLTGKGPWADGQLQYQAIAAAAQGAADGQAVRHQLRATVQLNSLDRRWGLDSTAQFSQQALSAFGVPLLGAVTPGAASPQNLFNPNIVDVLSLQVAPVWRLRLGEQWGLETRVQVGRQQREATADLPRQVQQTQAVQVSVGGGATLDWSVQATHRRQGLADERNDRVFENSQLQAQAGYPVADGWRLRVGAGIERQNLQLSTPGELFRVSPTGQIGLDWTPSGRTQARLQVSERFFGTGWQAGLNHRFSRLALRVSSARTLNDGGLSPIGTPPGAAGGSSFTLADLYDQLLARGEPDADRRGQRVADLLRARGVDGQSRVQGLSSVFGPVIQSRAEFGLAYVWPRQSLNLVAFRTTSQRVILDPLSPTEDLARFGDITQTALQAGWNHRLTPQSSLGLALTHLRAEGRQGILPVQTSQAELQGRFTLGPRLTGVLALRHTLFDNPNLAPGPTADALRRDTGISVLLVPQF